MAGVLSAYLPRRSPAAVSQPATAARSEFAPVEHESATPVYRDPRPTVVPGRRIAIVVDTLFTTQSPRHTPTTAPTTGRARSVRQRDYHVTEEDIRLPPPEARRFFLYLSLSLSLTLSSDSAGSRRRTDRRRAVYHNNVECMRETSRRHRLIENAHAHIIYELYEIPAHTFRISVCVCVCARNTCHSRPFARFSLGFCVLFMN